MRPLFPALSVLAQTAIVAGGDEGEIRAFMARIGGDPSSPSRRAFLKSVGVAAGTVAGAALIGQVEQALWVPGDKTFFLPPEKPTALVSGAEAEHTFRTMVPLHGSGDPRSLGPLGVHQVSTGAGEAHFDAHWNLLSVRGKPVTSREAAILQSNGYVHGMPPRHDAYELFNLEREIRVRRHLAGIKEPS